jgi:drug/metabolite transporter (DMT)-like permease
VPAWKVPALAIGMVTLLTAGWVLSGELVRQVPPLTVAAVRTASTFPVLTTLVLIRPAMRVAAGRAIRRWSGLLVLAVLGFLLYYGGTMLAIARIGAPATGIVVGLLPCVTLILGLIAFGEKAGAAKLAGTVVAVGAAVAYALQHGGPTGPHVADRAGTALGVALALAGTVSYALYGYVYRRLMGDLPSLASLPGITGVATMLLLPLAALTPGGWDLTARELLGLIFLGVAFTAPVFLISHELVLVRGPLFTTSAAVCVPFLIRVTEWLFGTATLFGPWEVLLFALAAGGVLIAVRADARRQEVEKPA